MIEPIVLLKPVISNTTPAVLASVTAEVTPKAWVAIPAFNVPPLIVVGPVYVFAPESVIMPVPLFVMATDVAVPLLIIPLYAAGLVLSLPIVIVLTPAVPDEFVIFPDPVKEPTVKLVFAKSKVPFDIVSKPEIVVAAVSVIPELLFIVNFAGVFWVSPVPVT